MDDSQTVETDVNMEEAEDKTDEKDKTESDENTKNTPEKENQFGSEDDLIRRGLSLPKSQSQCFYQLCEIEIHELRTALKRAKPIENFNVRTITHFIFLYQI